MRIRRFREGDTEGIIKMIDRAMSEFGESFDAAIDKDLLDIPRYYVNKGAFWVLTDNGKIVGSVAVSRVTDEICKFRRFYVDRDYRGRGWGGRLFDTRMKFAKARGYKTAWMVTSPNHKDVIAFVKKRGARKSQKRLFSTKRAHLFFIYDL